MNVCSVRQLVLVVAIVSQWPFEVVVQFNYESIPRLDANSRPHPTIEELSSVV